MLHEELVGIAEPAELTSTIENVQCLFSASTFIRKIFI